MIIGLGNDMVDIRRIENSLERFRERFTHRVFTFEERKKCDQRANRAASYAKRFAAKEACTKALGTGFSQGVYFSDIEVYNLPSGKPTLKLHNGALKRYNDLIPSHKQGQIDITISDDYPWAQAIVIISANDA